MHGNWPKKSNAIAIEILPQKSNAIVTMHYFCEKSNAIHTATVANSAKGVVSGAF